MGPRIAIVGAGELGRQLAHHALVTGRAIAGFFDDTIAFGEDVDGHRVIGPLDALEQSFAAGDFDEALIAIGYRHLAFRHELFLRLRAGVPLATIIHPTSWVDPTAVVEPGTIVYPGCVIDRQCRVAGNVLLNLGCVLAHDVEVGPSCFVAPGVRLAGKVRVGAACMLGVGTVVSDGVTLGPGVRTGAGAVVVDDLAEPGLYVGVPARLITLRTGHLPEREPVEPPGGMPPR